MARRGTKLVLPTAEVTGSTVKQWIPWTASLGIAGVGAKTGQAVIAIGKVGNTYPVACLSCFADNDEFGWYLPDMSDVDCTAAITFDYYMYLGTLTSGDEVITSVATTAQPVTDPAGTLVAAGIANNHASVVTLTGTVVTVYAAAQVENIINAGTKTLAANTITSRTTQGLIVRNIIQVTGTTGSPDIGWMGCMMKYTKY